MQPAACVALVFVLACTPACAAPVAPGPTSSAPEVAAGSPLRPRDASEAARQIKVSIRVIGDATATSDEIAVAGHAQQVAVREISTHARWLPRVLERLGPRMRRQTRDDVAASVAFRSMHPSAVSDLPDELPAWRIVSPPPAATLERYYREAERRFGVDWEYLAAINFVETAFGRIRGTSVAGAQGPMQFMPSTWASYGAGGDINDPHDAILAAGRLLQANGFSRDKAGAIFGYNHSAAYVRGVSLRARVIERQPRAFVGYHAWQVYYLTQRGSVWLKEGYASRRPIPVDRYLAHHPGALV